MNHSTHRTAVVASVLLAVLSGCSPTATLASAVTSGSVAFKAKVVTIDPEKAKGFGSIGRFLGQSNLAVMNLQNKRPPLMPLNRSGFGTKQVENEGAEPTDVSADESFLNAGLSGSTADPVEKETTNADGSIAGTIDDNGDGSVDQTFTETKPVETANPDGTKSLAMTYTVDNKGEKDTFDVKETLDANGKVTGGAIDFTDDKLGKTHVDFTPNEMRLEPFPGMYLVLKPTGVDDKGNTKLVGDIVFDERFASSKQPPGNGLPEAQPMTTQDLRQWLYTNRPNPNRPPTYTSRDFQVGRWFEAPSRIAAAYWCIDNEVGEPKESCGCGYFWEDFVHDVRLDWCKTKNDGRWWATQHRDKLQREGKIKRQSIDNPSLRVQVTMVGGNKANDTANLILTLPNGSETRISMPATGDPSGKTLDK